MDNVFNMKPLAYIDYMNNEIDDDDDKEDTFHMKTFLSRICISTVCFCRLTLLTALIKGESFVLDTS